ncbi:adenylate/guanylate cyclase domain-containing protein [Aliikangiella sp. IMCC44359]|uniref:adenylate/guanylate cyclase domain-containing protein n=1 Tax=Aliikangiella sp. IMCC44359 TaxID=3459125 RepID=UPI00403A8900
MIQRKKYKTILFADISGSSALYKTKGNLEAKKTVDSLLHILMSIVEQNKGKVIKTIGDEIMASFNESDKALLSAVVMQQNNSLLSQSELKLSIGIGYGEILIEDRDIFGEAVNDAAHLTTLAKGGQILLAESVYTQLKAESQRMIREFDRIKIKGARENSSIYRVYWQEDESEESETQLMSAQMIDNVLKSHSIQIKYCSKIHIVTAAQTPFVIGRDAQSCDLLVEGSQVSREHCEINFSRGKFVLVDHSTNGCYLSLSNKEEFYLRREEYPLIGPTIVSLGIPIVQAEEIIELFY